LTDDLGDLVIADPTRRAGTRLVVNTIHAQLREPPPPFAHRVRGRAEANADVLVVLAFGGKQNDTRPLRQPLRGLSPRRQALQLPSLDRRQIDRNRRLAHRRFSANQSSQRIAHICRPGH